MSTTVTLEEIARRLNLSAATVSRSLRHDPLIHPATRARVNETAAAMGYQGRARRGPRNGAANATAPAGDLAAGTETRGGQRVTVVTPRKVLAVLVASGDLARAQHHGNFMRLLEGITAECDGVGALASLHTLPPSAEGLFGGDPERTPAIVRDRHCDAVIVTGNLPAEDIGLLARLAPTITLSRVYDNITADAVIADNLHGIRMLVRYLVGLGHRRLAFVSDTYEASFFAERRAGFFAGCVEAGIAPEDMSLPVSATPGSHDQDWADGIVALSRSGTTAFVCANDLTAFRTMAVLEAAGISIPGAASVTGFDRVLASSIPLPFDPPQRALTTLDPNFAEMGRCAVRLALQRLTLAAVPPLRLTVAGNLVEGDTVGKGRIAARRY